MIHPVWQSRGQPRLCAAPPQSEGAGGGHHPSFKETFPVGQLRGRVRHMVPTFQCLIAEGPANHSQPELQKGSFSLPTQCLII